MTHKSETLHQILPEKRDGAISSVIILPDKMEFETQNPNERVYIMLRRHLITNLGWIVGAVFMCLLPILAIFFIEANNIDMRRALDISTSLACKISNAHYGLYISAKLIARNLIQGKHIATS